MRLNRLTLKNIGPFDEAELTFHGTSSERAPVCILTGENGTGKSIVLDAIRGFFSEQFFVPERKITRPGTPFLIQWEIEVDGQSELFETDSPHPNGHRNRNQTRFNDLSQPLQSVVALRWDDTPPQVDWIVDFWRSSLANDSYQIENLSNPLRLDWRTGALQGTYRNADLTQLLCYLEWMADSRDPSERRLGEQLYETAKQIVSECVQEGGLLYIARATLTPMIRQVGQEVPLENISSGNAYLMHRLLGLLRRMLQVSRQGGGQRDDITQTPGLLLIDEAENHLHPHWQKRLIPLIQRFFPKLQVIATTHSPFVLASVSNARVYLCRWDGNTCRVEEQTLVFGHLPVDQILATEAFGETRPFSLEITQLLEQRTAAISARNEAERHRIEARLLELNPDYFGYLRLPESLRSMLEGLK